MIRLRRQWTVEFLYNGEVQAHADMPSFYTRAKADRYAAHLTIMHRTRFGRYGEGDSVLYRVTQKENT